MAKEKKVVTTKSKSVKKTTAKSEETQTASALAHQDVILYPVLSEKAMRGESKGEYTFIVRSSATKVEIKKAIQKMYAKVPAKVTISNSPGKVLGVSRNFGRRSSLKKAIVIMPKGEKLSVHSGV